MPIVVYLSHPTGEGHGASRNGSDVDNLVNVGEWMRFFVDTTRWVILAPWLVYAITHGDSIHTARRLVDQISALERCDLLIQVGGFISPHMRYEARAAKRVGIPVLDLTDLGLVPPNIDEDVAQLLISRVARVLMTGPRRVWLPLFTTPDIEAFKALRHAVDVYLPDEHKDALDMLDRIIGAALARGEW